MVAHTHHEDEHEDEEYSTFNDPHKVASKIIEVVGSSTQHYTETLLERGTLV